MSRFPNPTSIREATLADVETLEQFEKIIFPDNCLNQQSIQRELQHDRCWLHEHGYLLTRFGELVDILRLGVLPEHRGNGLGRTLLHIVLEEAQRPIILCVAESNVPARRLYESEGFTPVGWLPGASAIVLRRPA